MALPERLDFRTSAMLSQFWGHPLAINIEFF
jgi:hypothetical protein